MKNELERILQKNTHQFHPVVDFEAEKDKLFSFDFTDKNITLSKETIADTGSFSKWVNDSLEKDKCRYGIGGYNENRVLYKRSQLFEGEEARSLHLGIDIWGPAGTPVYAPLGGMVHSFAYNDNFGDYGATIILLHQLETISFHTLYGHLSLADIANVQEGAYINRGQVIGHFGTPAENGNWPPHLHFQVIRDLDLRSGDYPGVCKITEGSMYLNNCPDPDLILNLTRFSS